MIKFYKAFERIFQRLLRSIAFLPIIISFGYLLFGIIIFYSRESEFILYLREQLPQLFVQEISTARTILSVIIGGIISLTVFSFSMVMVVLSQATTNFSPRLIPELIADRKHQVILGIYVGTLLFTINSLLYLGTNQSEGYHVGISVTISAFFCLICIGLFAYFIHNISNTIQVTRIIKNIHDQSKSFYDNEINNQKSFYVTSINEDTSDWHVIESPRTGYFGGLSEKIISQRLKKTENKILILPYDGQYVWSNEIIIKTKHRLSQVQKSDLLNALLFSARRLDDRNTISGLIKLSEVAVKALSPGINDPGTANDALLRISNIMSMTLQLPPQKVKPIKDTGIVLISSFITTKELLRLVIQPIRFYGKDDLQITFTLVKSLKYLESLPHLSEAQIYEIEQELALIQNYISERSTYIAGTKDEQVIQDLFKKQ